jgi:three-Cys-motif partner protein
MQRGVGQDDEANAAEQQRDTDDDPVLDDITERGARLAPTFAFLDPFGYSDAPMSLTGRFLQFRGCEVLIYVPFPDVHRFIEREGQERALNSLFGGSEWEEAKSLEGHDRLDFLHDLFNRADLTAAARNPVLVSRGCDVITCSRPYRRAMRRVRGDVVP